MSIKMKYPLSRVMQEYPQNILVVGLEETLSSPVPYEKHGGLRYMTSRFSPNAAYLKGFMPSNNLVTLSASYKTDGSNYDSAIALDESLGDILQAECSCNEYKKTSYVCKHILTLLMSYLLDRDGHDAFKGTALEKALIKKTGCPTPFVPGILKKTDAGLLSLTKKRKEQILEEPIWVTSPKTEASSVKVKNTALLGMEVHLRTHRASFGLELKVGPKRHYVIKQLDKLLTCYRENLDFSFTNSVILPAGKTAYEKDHWEVMDFICDLYYSNKRNEQPASFFWNTYSDYREAAIKGTNLDQLMQLLNHKQVYYTTDQGEEILCNVDLDREPRPLTMEKEDFGAKIIIPNELTLACGANQMYILQDKTIFRLPAAEWDNRREITALAKNGNELYIREADLPALAESLNDLNKESTQLATVNFSMQDYLPEIPKASIYLDYPQPAMISCAVQVTYDRLNKSYSLFDQKTDGKFRNPAAERDIAAKIWPFFTSFDQNEQKLYLSCDSDELFDFLTITMPRLGEIGEVFISDQLNRFRVRSAGRVDVGIQVESGSLLMSLKSNQLDRDEMIELLSSYDRRKKYTRLKNGTFITMDESFSSTFATLAEAFQAYGKKDPEALKLPLFRALYMEEMLQNREDITLSQSDTYVDLIGKLHDDASRSYTLPASLEATLRPYQKDGFSWISMLKENGFGGILADDMGLGKTLQVLAFLLSQKEAGKEKDDLRTLIVCPASLVYNWKKEVETFTPSLSVSVLAGTAGERKKIMEAIGSDEETDIYITSYDTLKRDINLYDGIHFANQIIDEAQYIKNQTTQAAKGVRLIDSAFRMALTGTPIENRLSELWSIFDYLMPGFLYNYTRFRAEYEAPVISDHDEYTMDRLRRMVHPFILRRLKKDVLKDLPDKLEETLTVRMEKEQRKIYDAYAERLRLFLDKQSDDEFHQNKLAILAELTKLRQICCGPELFLEKYKGGNAKKDACIDLVERAIDGGHKILLFSQYTSVLDELEKTFKKEKIASYRIDGSVTKERRMKLVEAFNEDETPIFLISLKAGGTGLNLTAADIVIHYDPWWNVAAQNQATDRAHRIGQTNTVTVYQLIVEKTIEEQIVLMQQAKAKLAEDVLEGEGIASIMIHKEDLLSLL